MYENAFFDGLRGSRKEVGPGGYLFFHPRNVESVGVSIRYAVYRRTRRVIDPQPREQIIAVMKAVFEEVGPVPPTAGGAEVVRLVRAMNEAAVERAARDIEDAIGFHLWYLSDIARPNPEPQSRGVLSTRKGESPLVFPHFDSVYS